VGIIGFLVAPERAGEAFFSASAQIVPVLLLALVLEARLFASPRRVRAPTSVAHMANLARQALGFANPVVLLAAEAQSLWMIRDGNDGGNPWLTAVGIGWGLVTIVGIAIVGTAGRARVTATIKVEEVTAHGVTIEVGFSNEFGDRAVRPVLNILFDSTVAESVRRRNDDGEWAGPRLLLNATATLSDGTTVRCRYNAQRAELTPGDASVTHFLLPLVSEQRALVVARADSVELPRGRIEHAAFVERSWRAEHVELRA